MPTAKALKKAALSSNPWWCTLAKWRNLTTGTSVESRTDREPMDSPFEERLFRQAERYFDGKSGSR